MKPEVLNVNEFLFEVSERIKTAKVGVLIRMDIFEMGYINMKYGSEKGRKIIEEVGKFLRQNLRSSDLIGKVDPDEFALFVEIERKEDLFSVLKRIESISSLKFEDVSVFFNSGVCVYPYDGINPTEIFEKAGFALKEAKKLSPNATVLYSKDIEEKITNSLMVQSIIKEAIDMSFFKFYYQPIFSSKVLKLYSAEALSRIVDDKVYNASEFIHLLEVHPFIYEFEENLIKTSVFNVKNGRFQFM